jgi:hypothetical protein
LKTFKTIAKSLNAYVALAFSGLCLLAVAQPAAYASIIVHYPRAESAADERVNYYSQLLNLCLTKSGKAYQLEPTQFHVEQERALQLVESNRDLEIFWTFTTSEREEKLMPIRIPIDRGLLGWRLFLIKASNQALFNAIETPEQLAKLRAGQGHDWPDTDILKSNNFLISSSTTYEGLFDMLARNHIQYFPRSLLEIDLDLNSHPNHGLAIESHLLLHYPTALYFFVNKHNTELAADLEKGLRTAIDDGSFKKLFDQHFNDTIRKSNLTKRKIININNPLLPAKTPLSENRYWFSPEDNY